MICTFRDICERDMDLLFLEEFAVSSDFLRIFTQEIDAVDWHDARVVEIEQSKTDTEWGESDMTIIVEANDRRYGLLIEDKIDAIAMENQAGRYIYRANKDKSAGIYAEAFVFIVAPQRYLEDNEEAKKYPYRVSYEDCLAYFERFTDPRSQFKAQQLRQALEKQKKGYQVIENTKVTAFWRQYFACVKERYSDFLHNYNGEARGFKSTWPIFHVAIGARCYQKISIIHKSAEGYVDMEFRGLGARVDELRMLIKAAVGDLSKTGFIVERTSKSAVVRIVVEKVDFREEYTSQEEAVNTALQAVRRLYDLLDRIPNEDIDRLYE